MFEDTTTAAACSVYHAYKRNVEALGGRYDKDIIHDQKHWLKAARLALINYCEPARFVNAQFLVLDDDRKRAMTPRMLYTPASKALSAYTATSPSPCDYHKIYAALAYTVKSVSIRRNEEPMEIISDPEQMLPPWFRILAAPVLTSELKDDYLEAAKSEISEDMYLKKFIKDEDKHGRFSDPDNKR